MGEKVESPSIAIENWVNRLKPHTGVMARKHIGLFMRWLRQGNSRFKDFTPDELVEYQKSASNGHRFDITDLVQSHILSLNGCRKSSKLTRYTYLRSFFLHNRAELPHDRSFKIRGDMPPARGDLTVEEVKSVRRFLWHPNTYFLSKKLAT